MGKKPNLDEFHDLTEVDELRRQVSTLQGKLRRQKTGHGQLVDAVQEGARDALVALGPFPKVTAPKLTGKGKPETAVWHLTDWQGAKVTSTYNSEVMRERVLKFVTKAKRLTQIQRADHPVDEAVILFGGDGIEGLFNFPSQPFEVDSSLFGQFAAVARLEAEVVRQALAIYKKVTVVQEWGNHGRIGNKRAVVPPADNVDRMCYELARAVLSDAETGELHDRLTWKDSEEDVQRVQIGKYRALLIHGDEVGRNGYASPQTMLSKCSQWKAGAYPWRFQDVYCGHYHNHSEWELPDGTGSLFYTGSPESDNRYARITMASSSRPSQRLHFVDPAKGRVTAQYKVSLT